MQLDANWPQILSPRKRMPELWTQRNPVLVCMSFALDLHVINFMFKCTILPPQFFSPRVHSAAAPSAPIPSTTFLILFLLPARVPSPQLPPLLARTHLPNTQNRFLGSYPLAQEGHPCLSPLALRRAGAADSKRASQQIPAPFSLVINGAALPMNLPLILRKL